MAPRRLGAYTRPSSAAWSPPRTPRRHSREWPRHNRKPYPLRSSRGSSTGSAPSSRCNRPRLGRKARPHRMDSCCNRRRPECRPCRLLPLRLLPCRLLPLRLLPLRHRHRCRLLPLRQLHHSRLAPHPKAHRQRLGRPPPRRRRPGLCQLCRPSRPIPTAPDRFSLGRRSRTPRRGPQEARCRCEQPIELSPPHSASLPPEQACLHPCNIRAEAGRNRRRRSAHCSTQPYNRVRKSPAAPTRPCR